ncbi:SubName: Full=Uncharacterized protein {ECO:0000313/EMBL:CCA77654.1} [Serendipita indica DSM 11827]|nr:SubName: Full=Uncharacterized protein {ECO:0000313/EMBL:CCA77654.1} [Serendipita indica DSM 11827]
MLAWFYLAVAVQVALGFVAISSFITIIEFRGTICAFARPPPKGLHILVAGCFLSVLPCETVILVATYLHAIEAKQKHFLSRESAALPVLRRMYQDGAIYLLIAFGTRLGGSIVWLACPAELKFVSDFLIYSLSSVVSTRFFLGLRQLVHRPTVQTQCPTTLEGSLFVDTYSLPVAMTRNPDPSIRDAGAAVYLYDFALTLAAEIQFFWTTRSAPVGRYLFLFTRYAPILGLSIGLIELNPFRLHLSDQMYVKSLFVRANVTDP